MGLLPVLVYYASVGRGGRVVAEFKNRALQRDLSQVAVECLEQVPPLHSRFTLTTKRRIFSCLLDDGFTYCCIVDEALGKGDAFSFLEGMKDEFTSLLASKGGGLQDLTVIGREFTPTIKVLTLPLIGVPQKEIDSLKSPNGHFRDNGNETTSMTHPLYSSSERSDGMPSRSGSRALGRLLSIKSKRVPSPSHQHPQQQQRLANGNINMVQQQQQQQQQAYSQHREHDSKVEIVVESSSSGGATMGDGGDLYPHRKSFSVREAENRWWRNLKIVLVVDVVVCIVLFAIWLGICKGFECVS